MSLATFRQGLDYRDLETLWRATLDGVLVRVPKGDEVVKLSGTGAALWAELEDPGRFGDVCEVVRGTLSI